MNKENINCRNCKNYYITWDVKFPYGCRIFQVKSKSIPSVIVYQSIGKPCDQFMSKNK